METGQVIKYLRSSNDVKLKEFANKIDQGIYLIPRYERNEKKRNPSELIALADYFGVSRDFF